MARVGSQSTPPDNVVYTPPRLPAFLADTHSLKPIVGVPADEEVKSIHAAIRAVNRILDVPALYDPDLPMQLTQHLFNVQMAVYRKAYSFGIFPGDATYAPPPLPSHIPITLEPVVGAPSDEELKLVQNAVRAVENLANTPSIFDPDLSMRISQHLFNIQIARYIQLSTQGQFIRESDKVQMEAQDDPLTLDGLPSAGLTVNLQSGAEDEAESFAPKTEGPNSAGDTNPIQPSVLDPAIPKPSPMPQQPPDAVKDITNTAKDITHLFDGIGDTLRYINQALISTQHCIVGSEITWDSNALINQKGELPMKYGLPRLKISTKYDPPGTYSHPYLIKYYGEQDITDQQLAAFLKFYNIGGDLIRDDGEPTIITEKKIEAEKLLYKYVVETPGAI